LACVSERRQIAPSVSVFRRKIVFIVGLPGRNLHVRRQGETGGRNAWCRATG
jgi:hypothetical protein